MREFSKFQIASFKRTAQNVYPLVRRKTKLLAEIEERQKELESIQIQIDAYQTPIKEATGGYSTEDLIVREVVATGATDKNGNPVKVTTYKLKYPETIIPVEPTTPQSQTQVSNEQTEEPTGIEVINPADLPWGNEENENEETNVNFDNIEII